MLAGCIAEEQAVVSALRPTTAPATCTDALYNVVQAEQSYDAIIASANQVREAVLAANSLCGQRQFVVSS